MPRIVDGVSLRRVSRPSEVAGPVSGMVGPVLDLGTAIGWRGRVWIFLVDPEGFEVLRLMSYQRESYDSEELAGFIGRWNFDRDEETS